eukprot:CAMPEP_0181037906 /NCGR_PEP_ID=MMETSP1070-20121207/9654_1 /TAXON_ID=265543 /ORGANISM="Minutocellus polymorphus, Strain NH13" /LENGTH=275 /DNA_ID=CAMNT_0023115659 /DNA_START=591 /DNA_END=1414 /DNA_ORIENTATION=+
MALRRTIKNELTRSIAHVLNHLLKQGLLFLKVKTVQHDLLQVGLRDHGISIILRAMLLIVTLRSGWIYPSPLPQYLKKTLCFALPSPVGVPSRLPHPRRHPIWPMFVRVELFIRVDRPYHLLFLADLKDRRMPVRTKVSFLGLNLRGMHLWLLSAVVDIHVLCIQPIGLAFVVTTGVVEQEEEVVFGEEDLEAIDAVLNLQDHPVICPVSFRALAILKCFDKWRFEIITPYPSSFGTITLFPSWVHDFDLRRYCLNMHSSWPIDIIGLSPSFNLT